MRLIPRSTARRSTAMASSWSFGGPQMPSPVMRMAPKPRRRTVRSPKVKVPTVVSSRAIVEAMVGVLPPTGAQCSALADLGRPDRRRDEGTVGHPAQDVCSAIDADDLEAARPRAEGVAHANLGPCGQEI